MTCHRTTTLRCVIERIVNSGVSAQPFCSIKCYYSLRHVLTVIICNTSGIIRNSGWQPFMVPLINGIGKKMRSCSFLLWYSQSHSGKHICIYIGQNSRENGLSSVKLYFTLWRYEIHLIHFCCVITEVLRIKPNHVWIKFGGDQI